MSESDRYYEGNISADIGTGEEAQDQGGIQPGGTDSAVSAIHVRHLFE